MSGEQSAQRPTRAGFVALIGAPNAGKSTLVNRFVGTKVSIVTHKVQTTRALIRGIAIHDRTQIVFVDTPGIFAPRRTLDRAMVETAWGGAYDADVVLVVIDAERGISDDAERMLDRLEHVRQPKALILNKIDRVAREKLLELAAAAAAKTRFERTFMVSALSGSGCGDVLDYLAEVLPESPWYYPEDQISDLPMRQLAAEITREKLYLRLHQELPYASHVETESWEERKDGSVRINQVIYVERESQRKIVLGRGGETIKAIGRAARKELTGILEQPVHLFLFVKVREDWGRDPERYREMGLEFPRLAMEWRDEGIVLGTRRHGETSAILEVMTAGHGRHLGLVRGGRSRRMQPVLQPGNSLDLIWRARLDEHLGTFQVEPVAMNAARLMAVPAAVHGLQVMAAHLRLLPERDPHAAVYETLKVILDHLEEPSAAAELIVRFELLLLEELGFGLDLSRCAATGRRDELAFVSPKSGRAVSREAGMPWRERMLALPPFLIVRGERADLPALEDAFRLTGFFLSRHVYQPRGLREPDSRSGLVNAVRRSLSPAAAPIADE